MADLGGTLPVRIQVRTWLIIRFWCWAWWSRTPLSSSAWQREGMVDGGGGVGDGDEEGLEGESGGRVDVGDGGLGTGCGGRPCSDHQAREGEEKSAISWECGDREEVGRENGIGW